MSNIKNFIAEEFIKSRLSSDATLIALLGSNNKIFADVAPKGISFPIITFRYQVYADVGVIDGNIPVQQYTYIVAATIDGKAIAAIKPIADRVDELLHKSSGTVNSGTVLSCTFDSIYRQAYTDVNGIDYRDLGGMYNLMVQ